MFHKAWCDRFKTGPVQGGSVGEVFGTIATPDHRLWTELGFETSFLCWGRPAFCEGALPGMKMG